MNIILDCCLKFDWDILICYRNLAFGPFYLYSVVLSLQRYIGDSIVVEADFPSIAKKCLEFLQGNRGNAIDISHPMRNYKFPQAYIASCSNNPFI